MDKTLVMIKPDAIRKGVSHIVMNRFLSTGLRVKKRITLQMTREMAGEFYHEHLQRPGFSAYLEFMASGPVTAAILEGEDAVSRAREILGSWDPSKAKPGTVRADFGTPDDRGILNVAHASDSQESASREIAFFFAQ